MSAHCRPPFVTARANRSRSLLSIRQKEGKEKTHRKYFGRCLTSQYHNSNCTQLSNFCTVRGMHKQLLFLNMANLPVLLPTTNYLPRSVRGVRRSNKFKARRGGSSRRVGHGPRRERDARAPGRTLLLPVLATPHGSRGGCVAAGSLRRGFGCRAPGVLDGRSRSSAVRRCAHAGRDGVYCSTLLLCSGRRVRCERGAGAHTCARARRMRRAAARGPCCPWTRRAQPLAHARARPAAAGRFSARSPLCLSAPVPPCPVGCRSGRRRAWQQARPDPASAAWYKARPR